MIARQGPTVPHGTMGPDFVANDLAWRQAEAAKLLAVVAHVLVCDGCAECGRRSARQVGAA